MLVENGVEVIGVSGDSVRNQQLFKKAHGLNFTLLADIKGDTARKFGVPVGKGGSITQTLDGKEEVLVRGVTARRWTFVIGTDGRVAYKNPSVNAGEDSRAVLEVVKKLKQKER